MALIVPLCLWSTAALCGTWSDLWLTPDQQGQRLLESHQPAEAAQRFSDPRRRGYAQLQAGHYEDAATQLAPFKDIDSEYNRGNALAHGGHLQEALDAYDAALAQDPQNRDIKHNRDLVARALQQQRPPDQKGGGSSGSHSPGSGSQNGSGSQAPGSQSSGSPSGSAQPGSQSPGGSQQQGSQPQTQSQGAGSDTNAAPGSPDTNTQQVPAGSNPASAHAADRNTTAGAGASARGPQAQGDNGATNSASNSGNHPGDDAGQAQRDAAVGAGQLRQQHARQQQPAGGGTATASGNQSAGPDATSVARAAADASALKPQSEQSLALEQWLRRIPEDPGGLLRRKFLIEHMMQQQANER